MDLPFRVRHLQAINVRNLTVDVKDFRRSSVFFALSTMDRENLGYFYESSKCSNVLNPYWENLDLSYENIRKFSFLDNFIITFFTFQNNKNKIIVEIKVNISGLSPLNNLYQRKKEENYFTFQFNGIIHSFDIDEPSLRSKLSIDHLRKAKLPKTIYSRETINKFMYSLSEDHQRLINSITIKRQHLESQIYNIKNKIQQFIVQKSRVVTIRSEIELLQKVKDAKQKDVFQLRLSNTILKEKLDKVSDNSENTSVDISKQKIFLRRYKDAYLKISNEYMLRMYQMIHELARIFPITPTEIPSSNVRSNYLPSNDLQPTTITIRSSDKLSIVNLHLPNSDKQIVFSQDVTSFAALGMVFKLLSTLSQIYDIPLRYPMFSIGVKAIIRDNIIDLEDVERNFLLIKNSSENFRLQYAIYLLNLNIAAIRGYFSISTKYTENTLWNISTLIEGKNRMLGSQSIDEGPNSNFINLLNTSPQLSSFSTNNSPHSSRSTHKLSPLVTQNVTAIN